MIKPSRRSMRPFSQLRYLASLLGSQQNSPETATQEIRRIVGPRIEDHLVIPVCEQSRDDVICRDAQLRGQFLARQDRWEDLAAEIAEADRARTSSPSGVPFADLLAWGARADVIRAAEHVLSELPTSDDPVLMDGIRGLEAARSDMPDDPAMAMIVALTHIDLGWAWRNRHDQDPIPELDSARCAAHFDRAAAILAPWCGVKLDSPAIAATHCALLAGQRLPGTRIADDYEQLIDLDRRNYRHMRALGNHMLPRWFGSYVELELEARRTAARTQDIWGDGGYTWVCFDAIAQDDEACARVDVDFFLDGLRDIVTARPEQEMINLLAAYCAVALPKRTGQTPEADLPRVRISEAASWLIRDHLTELHPMIWAHAASGFDNNARITSPSRFAARGRADALRIIAEQFREDIDRGRRVVFTPNGPELRPG